MSQYKTPGVYVVEKSALPPSVGEVPSAIPAFVGYTEKASRSGESLHMKPTPISSLKEFEDFFGKGPQLLQATVSLNAQGGIEEVEVPSSYRMYLGLRMFYLNGGGQCWVVSVGTYEMEPKVEMKALEKGLDLFEERAEPTLLVIPDAVSMERRDCYNLQQKMLKQCKDLKNRFSIFDIPGGEKKWTRTGKEDDVICQFRNNIGMEYLDYGSAYYPWIETAIGPKYSLDSISFEPKGTTLKDILGEQVSQQLDDAQKMLKGQRSIQSLLTGVYPVNKKKELLESYFRWPLQTEVSPFFDQFDSPPKKTDPKYQSFETEINQFKVKWDLENLQYSNIKKGTKDPDDAVKKVLDALKDLLKQGKVQGDDLESKQLKEFVQSLYSKFKTQLDSLDANKVTAVSGAHEIVKDYKNEPFDISKIPEGENVADFLKVFLKEARDKAKYDSAKWSPFFTLCNQLDALERVIWNEIHDWTRRDSKNLEQILAGRSSVIKNILDQVSRTASIQPPSSALAGVYTRTDNNRGVWKAPANVSLSATVGPCVPINDKQQEDLNVDTTAGKSINAIRAFAGKGTLVWGARTLMGASNEWRYISVRRTFIMVEESLKRATAFAVFEPNDSVTWTTVKAMISNYLTNLWQAGGLVGSSPEEAFFVNVGLGTTMTPQDVLEGRMNVEIGMAVVRPAEFIVLTFSHKLQE